MGHQPPECFHEFFSDDYLRYSLRYYYEDMGPSSGALFRRMQKSIILPLIRCSKFPSLYKHVQHPGISEYPFREKKPVLCIRLANHEQINAGIHQHWQKSYVNLLELLQLKPLFTLVVVPARYSFYVTRYAVAMPSFSTHFIR